MYPVVALVDRAQKARLVAYSQNHLREQMVLALKTRVE